MPSGIYIKTDEHRKKLSESLKGNKNGVGNKTRFLKGVIPWNKNKKGYRLWPNGRVFSEETKKRMGISKLGRKLSEETKRKMSVSQPKGENSPHWKGGNSRGYKTGYYSAEYKEWRMKVFIRDGFKCQSCGIIGTYLTAHHIKSFAHYPKLRFEINNGITLCEDCHKLTDNYKGKNKQ